MTNWRNNLEKLGCSFNRITTSSAFSYPSSAMHELESSIAGVGIRRLQCVPSWKLHAMLLQDREPSQWKVATDQCANSVMLSQLSCFPALGLSVSQRTASEVGQPWDHWDWGSPLIPHYGLMRADLLLSWEDWSCTGSLDINSNRQDNFQSTSMVLLSWRHQFWDSKVLGSV